MGLMAGEKWTMPLQNWKFALNRFSIMFKEGSQSANPNPVYTKFGTPSAHVNILLFRRFEYQYLVATTVIELHQRCPCLFKQELLEV